MSSLTSLNGNILCYPENFEIQKTVKAGLAAPLVKSIRSVKVVYDYEGEKISLRAGDDIFVSDDYIRQSKNIVKLVLDGTTKDLLLVKESDIIAVRGKNLSTTPP